jgi:signal peptidase I
MWILPPIIGVVVLSVGVIVFCWTHFVPAHYVIPQNGMYPSLPAGSHVFAMRHPYSDPCQVARGDVVIFTAPSQGQETVFVWRVVGLPGDAVQTKGNEVIINGQALKHEFVRADEDMQISLETNGEASYEIAFGKHPPEKPPPDVDIILPPGQYFVMGDNRNEASDSRYRGPIAFEQIFAKLR